MLSTSGILRKGFALFLAALLLGAFDAEAPVAAQFRMGYARFGAGRPVVAGRFGRGAMIGHPRGRFVPRYGWNEGGRRFYPVSPRYPVYPRYPGYPVYSRYPGYPVSRPVYPRQPVYPSHPVGGRRTTHHLVAQSAAPAARPAAHAHRGGGNGHRRIAAVSDQRFVPHEVVTEFAPGASAQAIDRLARRYNLVRVESRSFTLIGSAFYRWRIGGSRTVDDTVNALRHERLIASVEPNYVFTLQEQSIVPIVARGDPAQYVLGKLEVVAAHGLATGKHILVAVIDSEIDAQQPDLGGAIVRSFDALRGAANPHAHGTAMAGAIAAHGKLLGIAPDAELLAARAFDDAPGAARGTSFAIYKSLQWAADSGARVVNMSFAGPADPLLHRFLAAAYQRDMVLIAAAGNAGPGSAPLYPAADPDVIAVTATDSDDGLYKMANRGQYIALAAPGVEVLVIAPRRSYQITTGTSVAAAHVSGIAALLLERRASLTPADVRRILMASARPLGSSSQSADFGAGLADAYRAALLPGATSKPAAVQAKR